MVQVKSHLRATCIVPHYIKEVAIGKGPLVSLYLDGVTINESIHGVEFPLALWRRMCISLEVLYPVYFGDMRLYHSVPHCHEGLA